MPNCFSLIDNRANSALLLQASLYLGQYFSKLALSVKLLQPRPPGVCVLAWGMDTLYEKNLNKWMV
jgi:hypothetical protein